MKNLTNKIFSFIWNTENTAHPVWLDKLLAYIRIFYVVIRELANGQLTLRAMSLVYTTLLSLVPLIAVSFSVLKGFGVHNQVEPMLLNLLSHLGDMGVEITHKIIGFVSNMKVGVLGSLGLVLLLYTVISLIQKIEGAFNYTWNVSTTRSFVQRFSDYLSVIFVGPVFVFTAIGITATVTSATVFSELQSIQFVGVLVNYAGKAIPYLLVIVAFTFIYILIPNTKVKVRSALVGAIVSGLLWETSGWIFASFLVNSSQYTAIYSAFAALIFFLIWLYLNWIILLIGASISFYHQNPQYVTAKKISMVISNSEREFLALKILLEICQRYYCLNKEMTHEDLVKETSVPSIILTPILNRLEQSGYLVLTLGDPSRYFPARPLNKMKVIDVLTLIREDGRNYHHDDEQVKHSVIADMFETIDNAVENALNDVTFLDLVQKTEESKKENDG